MRLNSAVSEKDHYRGPLHAPIILIEYGDFQCPYSAKAFYEIENVLKELKGSICYSFRYFPVQGLHRHAIIGAMAAEAASRQGMFWPMHHMLFQNFDTIDEQSINKFAQMIGLDMELFQGDMANPDLMKRIERDYRDGVESGVINTPTLFLNGDWFDHPTNHHELVLAAEELMQTSRRKHF